MSDLALDKRTGLPDALRALVAEFPRGDWESHSDFQGLVSFWMERHQMFRKLCDTLRADAEAAVDAKLSMQTYAPRLARYGGILIEQLHAHHHIEDTHYFPQLIGFEKRLEQGFALLDSDHDAMDGLLTRLTNSANDVLAAKQEAGHFHAEILSFQAMLLRHLEDEEDLIVPVILKHGADQLR